MTARADAVYTKDRELIAPGEDEPSAKQDLQKSVAQSASKLHLLVIS